VCASLAVAMYAFGNCATAAFFEVPVARVMVMKTCKHTKQGTNTLPSSLTFFWSVDIQSQDCIETNEQIYKT
jgi:hypothetical protein